ncbi:hypothetical protein [Melaminivora jejuensis]|uniref:hypothetical protein n=1 Tax=Melaminivora jejuensis TaxID=1267217 RepID=UPI001AE00EFE|nr:hypothetical protein [Melaminivora jejuensis]UHJ63503.1 hypothetical protein LVC68_08585 [Melaminivora jejuensis]
MARSKNVWIDESQSKRKMTLGVRLSTGQIWPVARQHGAITSPLRSQGCSRLMYQEGSPLRRACLLVKHPKYAYWHQISVHNYHWLFRRRISVKFSKDEVFSSSFDRPNLAGRWRSRRPHAWT